MISKQTYAEMILNGMSIEINRLSLSRLHRFNGVFYQVHCDDYRHQFSKLYRDINDAVDEFIKIKNKIYKNKISA